MYKIKTTKRFEKDFVKCLKRGYDIGFFKQIAKQLEEDGIVDSKHKPHKLKGQYVNYWECHIKPDWLLIWEIEDEEKIITFIRTGTHSDLF